MANWHGASRTNYVRIKEEQALRQALEPWEITVHRHPTRSDCFMFEGACDNGDFPSSRSDDEDNEIDFSFQELIVPHLAEGQVLLAQVIGREKLRYLTGYAYGYAWDGRVVSINTNDIHKLAAETFGVDPKNIAHPTYQDLPESLPPQDEELQVQAADQERPRGA